MEVWMGRSSNYINEYIYIYINIITTVTIHTSQSITPFLFKHPGRLRIFERTAPLSQHNFPWKLAWNNESNFKSGGFCWVHQLSVGLVPPCHPRTARPPWKDLHRRLEPRKPQQGTGCDWTQMVARCGHGMPWLVYSWLANIEKTMA